MLHTNADLFLEIAREHLRRLVGLKGPRTVGRQSSPHLRHAIICSVFSAFAVEHAITELIWSRFFFQVPKPYQAIALDHARSLRNTDARLDFLRAATNLPDDLIHEMKRLIEYRNKIAHARPKPFEGKMKSVEFPEDESEFGIRTVTGDELQKLIVEKDVKHLELDGVGTPDIDIAPQNLLIAEQALNVLRSEMDSSEWPVFGPECSGDE